MNMTLDKGTNMLSVTLSSLKFGIISLSLTTKVFRKKKKERLLSICGYNISLRKLSLPWPPVGLLSQNQRIFEPTLQISHLNVERGSHTPVATRSVSGDAGPEPDLRAPTAPAVRLVAALCGLNFPC